MNLYTTIVALFLFFGYVQVYATTLAIEVDDQYCGYSDVDEDACSSYCYKSIKAPLAYIIELKEQMKAMKQEYINKENDYKEIKQGLIDLSDIRDQLKSNNQQIEELRKSIAAFGKSLENNNNLLSNTSNNNNQNQNENYLNKCIANQENFAKSIAQIQNQVITERKQLDEAQTNIKNLMEKDKIREEIELKVETQLDIFKANEDNLINQIKELKTQIAAYEKHPCSNQNSSLNKNSKKFKQMEKDLVESKEKLSSGCRGLPSGKHTITVLGLDPFSALCNGDIEGGGWIVILNRFSSSLSFNKNWTDYSNGFGETGADFFIGLDSLYRITNSLSCELYIELRYFNGTLKFANYNNFKIGNEKTQYTLESLGTFRGTAKNKMNLNLNNKFTTKDRDNDKWSDGNCAVDYNGGWWFNNCGEINLNGLYPKKGGTNYHEYMSYDGDTLKSVQMLIRPNSK